MGNKERILLVDDCLTILEGLKEGLKIRGYEVTASVRSVNEVILLLEKKQTDFTVAIVDNCMPEDGDGEKAVALIRKAIPNVKIISLAWDPQKWGDINLEKGATLKEIANAIMNL